MIPDERIDNQRDPDINNSLDFGQVILFFIKYMRNKADIIFVTQNEGKKRVFKTRNASLSYFSFTLSASPSLKPWRKICQPALIFSSTSDHHHTTPCS